jgi:hypothetical protein
MKAMALLMGLVLLQACVDSDDIGSAEQAEIIEVHGCRPGYWDIGDGICVDPWPGGGGGGGGPTGGESGPGGPGPGGGGGGGPTTPIPDRKDCTGLGVRECEECCYFNFRYVDGERCNRMKKGSEKRRQCQERAAEENARCLRECHRVVTTTTE